MVKCEETPFEGEGLVKIQLDSPCMMVLWKLIYTWANIWYMLDWIAGFCIVGKGGPMPPPPPPPFLRFSPF